MKNILIVTSTGNNQGAAYSFVKDISDIKESDLREMIENNILKKEWEKGGLWSSDDGEVCGGTGGYVFNDYAFFTKDLPVQVDHIVTYVF